jgi:multimeric flavodoxin WrbA
MKVLAIVGSPRTNGNTYKTIKKIEQRFVDKDKTVEFEYVQLSMAKLETCKGCYVCIEKGEEKCPLKDDRENLDLKMKQADAVIFASPVYTYNVSWIMKNFLDRFAYRFHRPDFHGKKAMVVISTGAVGLGFVEFLLSFTIGAMGFITCAKAGTTYAPLHERNEKKTRKETRKLNKQVDIFYRKIIDKKPIKPTFIKLLTFKMQQKAFSKAPQSSADFKFWKGKGWLEKRENYFYQVHIGNINKMLASLLSKLKV